MAELSSASCWLGARRLLSCSGLRFGAPFARRCRLRLKWRTASPNSVRTSPGRSHHGPGRLDGGQSARGRGRSCHSYRRLNTRLPCARMRRSGTCVECAPVSISAGLDCSVPCVGSWAYALRVRHTSAGAVLPLSTGVLDPIASRGAPGRACGWKLHGLSPSRCPSSFWTRTVWRDEAAMRSFMGSGVHHRIMARLPEWCDEAALGHRVQDANQPPSLDPGTPAPAARGPAFEGQSPIGCPTLV